MSGIRVRAKKPGFYCAVRWRPGDEFALAQPEHFAADWMERIAEPETQSPAPQSLRGPEWHRTQLGWTRRVDAAVDPDADRPVDFDFDPFV